MQVTTWNVNSLNVRLPHVLDWLAALLDGGFVDIFRSFDPPPKSYSWWDYRQGAFRRNAGLRIDLILLSRLLAERARSCIIDREARKREQPSDHAPVTVEIESY